MDKLSKLERLQASLLEIQGKFDKEPYKEEILNIRKEINELGGKDIVQIGYEHSKSIDDNIKVSLESLSFLISTAAVGIGLLIAAILKRVFGKSDSSGGGGGGGKSKSDFKLTIGGEDYDKVIKRYDKMDKEEEKRRKKFGNPNDAYLKKGVKSIFRDKKGYNITKGHYHYKYGTSAQHKSLLTNNPKNKILDVYADEIMKDLRSALGHYVLAVGGTKFSVEILKKAMGEVNKFEPFEYYGPIKDYVNYDFNFKKNYPNPPIFKSIDAKDIHKHNIDRDLDYFNLPAYLTKRGVVYSHIAMTPPHLLHGNDGIYTGMFSGFNVSFNRTEESLEIVDNTVNYDMLAELFTIVSKGKKYLDNNDIKKQVLGLKDKLVDYPDFSRLKGNYSDKAKEKLKLSLARCSEHLSDIGRGIYEEYNHETHILTNLGKDCSQSEIKTEEQQNVAQNTGVTTWKD